MNINKYINILKQNKNLLIPVGVLIGVFLYNVVSDFFSTPGSKKSEQSGTIELEKQFVTKEIKENANLTIDKDSELARKLLAEDEKSIKDKAIEEGGSYMSKNVIDKKDLGNGLDVKQIEEEKNKKKKNDYPDECKEDMITKIIVCKDKDGKTYLWIDGKRVDLSEEICTKSPYNALNECNRFMLLLEEEKKSKANKNGLLSGKNKGSNDNKENGLIEEQERGVDSRGLKNSNGNGSNNDSNANKKKEEKFGLDSKSKEYQRLSMLMKINESDTALSGNGSVGGILTSVDYLSSLNKKDEEDKTKSDKKVKLSIRPGSTYVAKLLNPLNSLYAEQVRPILDISGGDLDGYRLVGEITFSEASNGVIITGDKIVSPAGDAYPAEFTAIRYEGDELTPLFADEIDRHLGGRIGYSVLGALTSDYAGMMTTNNSKENTTVRPGETTSTKAGEVMSSTFEELAQQYVTEVKVNPQNMIVIFY